MYATLIFIASLAISNVGDTCLTSSDEYAVEAVIDSYNLFEIKKFSQNIDKGYAFPSQFNPDISAIVKETENPRGLSIRLQTPTELKETSRPYFKISALSGPGLKKNLQSPFFGWKISCSEDRCSFSKEDINIEAVDNGDWTEVFLEVTKNLNQCSEQCTGSCIQLNINSLCVDIETRSDIEKVLRYSNLSSTFEELLKSYRALGSEGIVINDIIPSISPNIDWQEAMRQELVFLKSNEAIDISNSDIENIALLAKRGQAGEQYRITYDFKTETWKYFNNIANFTMTGKRECKIYSIVESTQENSQVRKIYYIVPLVLTGVALLLFVILIVIARALNLNKGHSARKTKGHELKI